MQDQSVSPAVKSLRDEQAQQSATPQTRLEEGLEETFPASDPVSITSTVTAGGATTGSTGHLEELRTLWDDLANLRQRTGAVAAGAGDLVCEEMAALDRSARRIIDDKPFTALAAVAAASFVLGVMFGRSRDDR